VTFIDAWEADQVEILLRDFVSKERASVEFRGSGVVEANGDAIDDNRTTTERKFVTLLTTAMLN